MNSVEPCPNCNSEDVRWRRRRIYDVVFTEIRHAADTALGAIFGPTETSFGDQGFSDSGRQAELDAVRYRTDRRIYEDHAGSTTAVRFWKCRTCRKRGQVFGDPTSLTAGRDHLIAHERSITENLGGVAGPIRDEHVSKD